MMKFYASLFALLVILATLPTTHAQNLFWDVDTIAQGGAGGGGAPAGTWDVGTTPNWGSNQDGLGNELPGVWTDGNTAVFSAGSDATGSFDVTVSGAPSATGITFEEGTVINLNGGQIALTGATPTVTVNSSAEHHINSVITGGGTTTGLAAVGPGVLVLGGANTYANSTVVDLGTALKLGASGVIPNTSVVSLTRGNLNTSFQLNGFDETVKSITDSGAGAAGTFALGTNTLTLDDPNGEVLTDLVTSSGTLSGAHGTIIKNGTGMFTLNNFPTSFTAGEFIINSGTVGIGQNNVFGTSGAGSKLTINGGTLKRTGATINLAVTTIDIGGSFTYDNNGTADTQLLGSLANVVTTLKADPVITVIGGTSAAGTFIFAGNIVDDGNVHGFTKAGAGTMTIGSPNNAYRGETTIQEGFLRVRKQTNANANGAARIGDGNGRVNLSGGTLEYNGSVLNTGDPRTITVTNPLRLTSDSGIRYFSGTANLGATNTIDFIFSSDDITATGGTLTFSNAGSCTDNSNTCVIRPTFSGSGFNFGQAVVINNQSPTATRSTQLNSSNTSGTQTWSGNISGTGGYRRSGAGSTVFSGNNTFSGGVTVDGGTLTASGASATLGGGNVTVTGGNLGISSGVSDAIANTATLSLAGGGTGGTADVAYANLGTGINERVATLLLAGVAQMNGRTYGSTGAATAMVQDNEYFAGSGLVTVGLLGDYNGNNSVDAADYVVWRKSFSGNTAMYDAWRANYGNTFPGSGSGSLLGAGAGVPEPSALLLLICAAGSAMFTSSRGFRRRKI